MLIFGANRGKIKLENFIGRVTKMFLFWRRKKKKKEDKKVEAITSVESVKEVEPIKEEPIKEEPKSEPVKSSEPTKVEAPSEVPAPEKEAEPEKKTAPVKKSEPKKAVPEKKAESPKKDEPKVEPAKKDEPKVEPEKKDAEINETAVNGRGMYAIKRASDGRYMFNVHAGNTQIIASSQMYTTMASCRNGIKSVGVNAPIAAVEDQTLSTINKEKCPKFQIYLDKAGKYRFNLLAANGDNILSCTQGYTQKSSCKNGINSVIKNASAPTVIQEKE